MSHPLRKAETQAKYEERKKSHSFINECALCKKAEPIKKFEHWLLVHNAFPYDLIAETHHMLIPKRHITYKELTEEEKEELELLKATHLEENYETIAENTNRRKTIPQHFHLHLIVFKSNN